MRDFPGRFAKWTATRTTPRPQNQAGARRAAYCTHAMASDSAGATGVTEPAGLPASKRVHSAEHATFRSTDPVHTKKDGGLRMCTDYRALNRVTIKSRYPIPRTDELIDNLRGARYFSKINLRGGYHQIRVFADDCHKTAFRTRYGSYEYTVMLFGLTNAPSTFQLTMNGVFRDLLDKCMIIYLDDILIYSKTRVQHLKDLEAVFQRLQQHLLITKGSK
ncbi:hypothetical protein CLOP_g3341 [Closterium sp. NIES-67]|nr:hypothetical protein CLOP_g3341 [Closterium sp. NIES-67]